MKTIFKITRLGFIVLVLFGVGFVGKFFSNKNPDYVLQSDNTLDNFLGTNTAHADTPPPYAQGGYGGGDFSGDDCDGGGGCDGGGDGY